MSDEGFIRFGDVVLLHSLDGGGYVNGGGFVSERLWVDRLSGAAQGAPPNLFDACFKVNPAPRNLVRLRVPVGDS